jgi:hypothetical protein
LFATNTEIGEPNIWTRIMRITIEPSIGQTILSGFKVQRIQRLQGNETVDFSWLISGKGQVGINAGAANARTANKHSVKTKVLYLSIILFHLLSFFLFIILFFNPNPE